MSRVCGVLLHISSLSSPYGIGNLGSEAVKFVDFLEKCGQKYWQVLPLVPTSYGDSPYQSPSAYAGNPYFIDLDQLIDEGLLTKQQVDSYDFGDDIAVDFGKQYVSKNAVLRLAYDTFLTRAIPSDFNKFVKAQSHWLTDYAFFMALKAKYNFASWDTWDSYDKNYKKNHKDCDKYSYEIKYHYFLQYYFFKQWGKLKAYANKRGIQIIGDMPIYVAADSSDVWSNRKMFDLDRMGKPKFVAGCPPDGFSEGGQLWGNPLYKWNYIKKTNYSWWVARVVSALKLYDKVRIDHFRGFAGYYSIPYGNVDAKIGSWKRGAGSALFDEIDKHIGKDKIIAEDLGFITPPVKKMLKHTGYPGMKVLQFAFYDGDNGDYLPDRHPKNCIVYTGTHDNETTLGWFGNLDDKAKECYAKYCHFNDGDNPVERLIRSAMDSNADTAIIPMQDYLGLDNSARMNSPSVAVGNWTWRLGKGDINDELAEYIKTFAIEGKRFK